MQRMTPCLWFDGAAEEAARFYAETFPDSHVGAIQRAAMDYPAGKAGDVITVSFTLLGVEMLGLNGGSGVSFTDAISFQVHTGSQAETDRYWDAIVGNGGAESACGWCRDRFGVSWQITPRALTEAMQGPRAREAMAAMMTMRKIDIAAIEKAVAGA